MYRITVAEAERDFASLVNRVCSEGIPVELERGGESDPGPTGDGPLEEDEANNETEQFDTEQAAGDELLKFIQRKFARHKFADLLQAIFKNYEKFPEELQTELPLKRIWALVSEE